MSLITEAMTECTMLDKRTVPDGQGSYTQEWVDGAQFSAAIVKDSSMQARMAEKQGVSEVYTVTVNKGTPLDYHDVFRRDSDGSIFRVTSNITDSETPQRASFQIGQVTAEKWVLPS
jgi:head-tail adaptor